MLRWWAAEAGVCRGWCRGWCRYCLWGYPDATSNCEISHRLGGQSKSRKVAAVVQLYPARELVSVFQVDSDDIRRRWKSLEVNVLLRM